MNKYALAKQKTLAELCEKKDEHIKELKDELLHWVTQYGCSCEHPSCTKCVDTKAATNLVYLR